VEIIITPTAAANSIQARQAHLDQTDLEKRTREATKICCEAVGQFPVKGRRVFGAIGPVEPLLTLKEISEKELAECYRGQACGLAEAGVQGILCSRFSEIDALRIAVEAVTAATSLPVVAGMAFGSGPDFMETALGCSVAQMCSSLRDLKLLAIAADSERNPDALSQILTHLKSNSDVPIWVSCDAGYPQLEDAGVSYSDRPAEYASRFKGLAGSGTTYFEAGSGAGLAHVEAIKGMDKPHKSRQLRGAAAEQLPESKRS
jgi:methionine synthase I (cobalamin-dependent)